MASPASIHELTPSENPEGIRGRPVSTVSPSSHCHPLDTKWVGLKRPDIEEGMWHASDDFGGSPKTHHKQNVNELHRNGEHHIRFSLQMGRSVSGQHSQLVTTWMRVKLTHSHVCLLALVLRPTPGQRCDKCSLVPSTCWVGLPRPEPPLWLGLLLTAEVALGAEQCLTFGERKVKQQ